MVRPNQMMEHWTRNNRPPFHMPKWPKEPPYHGQHSNFRPFYPNVSRTIYKS